MFRNHVKDILTINNLVNTIEVPTRDTTSATLLDLIIVPDSEQRYLTQVLLKLTQQLVTTPQHTF